MNDRPPTTPGALLRHFADLRDGTHAATGRAGGGVRGDRPVARPVRPAGLAEMADARWTAPARWPRPAWCRQPDGGLYAA